MDIFDPQLFQPSVAAFNEKVGNQYRINWIHVNERGDRLIAAQLDQQIFDTPHPIGMDLSKFHRIREVVKDKSWLHLQDYRLLNGWYMYGGRHTWDTETFPGEYQKIPKMSHASFFLGIPMETKKRTRSRIL